MNVIQKALVFGALFVMCTAGAFSQLVWEMGYEYGLGGMNKRWITGSPALLQDPCCIPKVEENYLHTMWIGLGVQIPKFLGSKIDLKTQTGFAYSTGSITQKLVDQFVILPDPANPDTFVMANQSISYESRIWTRALWLDLLGRFPLSGPLRMESGLRLNYRIGVRSKQRLYLIEPSAGTFEDGTREKVIADGSNLASSPLSGGLMAGLTYDIPLTTAILLQPGLHLHIDVGTFDNGSLWDTYAIGATMGMLFNTSE